MRRGARGGRNVPFGGDGHAALETSMRRTIETVAILAASFALAAQAAAQDCDRQCLIDLADAYVAAMVAHDPGRVLLAANVVMVENATRIRPGEGHEIEAIGITVPYASPTGWE